MAFDSVTIKTTSASSHTNIYIEQGFFRLASFLSENGLANRRMFVVTDENVSALFLNEVVKQLQTISKNVDFFVIKPGEASKSFASLGELYNAFCKASLDRKSVIVALGGGVVGDLAGLAASTYMRGVPFVQVATTLLAQVDSSVGGKTAVDFGGLKNIIGTFYQPIVVYINIETLETLPYEQLVQGIAEAIKHGLIKDYSYFNFICENKHAIKERQLDILKELVYKSCLIKGQVVEADEKEAGLREILNFGHTFGHAIEALSGYTLLHGFAVSIGMACALHLSHRRGYINKDVLEKFNALANFFGLPTRLSETNVGYNKEEIYKMMLRDKKTKSGLLNIILLNGAGNAYTETNCSMEEVLDALSFGR